MGGAPNPLGSVVGTAFSANFRTASFLRMRSKIVSLVALLSLLLSLVMAHMCPVFTRLAKCSARS